MTTLTNDQITAGAAVLAIPTAIMNIECDQRLHDEYKRGHRDARHAAADLVLARADELKALAAPSPQVADIAELPPLPAQHEELRARWKCDSCDGRGHDGEAHYQGEFQPPEPYPCSDCNGSGCVQIEAYTAEQYRQGQRDAIAASRHAPQAAEGISAELRARAAKLKFFDHTTLHLLERAAAEIDRLATPAPASAGQAAKSIDHDAFWVLVARCRGAKPGEEYRKASAELVAYVDNFAAQPAEGSAGQAASQPPQDAP